MPTWLPLPLVAVLLLAALAIHTRIRGWLPEDPPATGRKRHKHPTPMAGLVPAAVAVAVAWLAALPWLAGGIAAAALTGGRDDFGKRHDGGLAWYAKGSGLLLASGLAAAQPALGAGLTLGTAAAVGLWIFVLANAANFLDNTDGVASSVGGLGLVLASGGEGPMLAIGLAWLAFVPFNWPTPRLFLGDGGSLPLGLCLGAATAELAVAPPQLDLRAALAPAAVLAADFTQVVVARLILGYAPWVGDRRHLTHIAMNLGLPAVWVAPVFAAVAALSWSVLR